MSSARGISPFAITKTILELVIGRLSTGNILRHAEIKTPEETIIRVIYQYCSSRAIHTVSGQANKLN
jgi:hypothetical protein